MTTKDELLALADRCEREEPTWDLNCAVAFAAGWRLKNGNWWKAPGAGEWTTHEPDFLRSLDAAVTLKPPHWYVADINQTIDGWNCTLTRGIADPLYRAEGNNAPTEAMARCAAALRARAAVSHQNQSAMRSEGEPVQTPSKGQESA